MKRSIPYARHSIHPEDIQAITEVLLAGRITQGPKIEEFERAIVNFCGAGEGVAVSNGTAALHAACFAAGIGPDDEVIVPPITFAASANAVVYQGGKPVFADVLPGSLLLDPEKAKAAVTPRTKAILAVDYAGQPCDYRALREIADRHGLLLIADSCHALGAKYDGRNVGTLADLTAFSFHAVKHITTGEGGMVVTSKREWADRMRLFRNHGITSDETLRQKQSTWYYEMTDLGFNYRITDIQCALGLSQLKRLPEWIARRRKIAERYDEAFRPLSGVKPLGLLPTSFHVYHLYVVRFDRSKLGTDRALVFKALREKGIGVNVHYIPVHLHPYYQKRFGTRPGLCPVAERSYEEVISLPMFPDLTDDEQEYVISSVKEVTAEQEEKKTARRR